MRKLYWLLLPWVFLGGCSTNPPSRIDDACVIYDEKSDWYDDTQDSYEQWGVPNYVQLAIIHQESRFKYDAKPPRKKWLGFIPLGRPTSAYGYAQVIDSTWDWYIRQTGNRGADRDDFGDAVDFIGWYGNLSHKSLGLAKSDAYNQYLAYHEGHTGFKRRTYRKKPWLIKVARKVRANAARYRKQLARCEDDLSSGGWFW